jgi:hypothetical protein
MGKVIILVIGLLLLGCQKQYKYKIVGNVMVNDTLRDAIWYTDTISFKNDTAYYFNSDESKVTISGKYVIYKN